MLRPGAQASSAWVSTTRVALLIKKLMSVVLHPRVANRAACPAIAGGLAALEASAASKTAEASELIFGDGDLLPHGLVGQLTSQGGVGLGRGYMRRSEAVL